MEQIIHVDVLIIGFGLTSIPLIRELELEGRDYTIISSGSNIWEKLEASDRLDFDMVSSEQTSMYSFELVKRNTQDNYATAEEFLSFQRKYFKKYGSKVIKDWVTKIENSETHSLVFTKNERTYKAKYVVLATAFKRKIHDPLAKFDFDSATGKTIVLGNFGDSINLIAAKLIPRDANVFLLTDGIMMADKFLYLNGVSYTLEQYEMHNIKKISKFIFLMLTMSLGGANYAKLVLTNGLAKIISGDSIYMRYPVVDRLKKMLAHAERRAKSPIPNGTIVLKYSPVDAFAKLFKKNLKNNIERGFLLNDIGFFLEQNLLQVWPKSETTIDKEKKIITWGDKEISYDSLIEGDREVPNLPIITTKMNTEYEYVYRNNFMGVLPKELHNVYLIGFTRPTTGGLVNLSEMQCLLTHKMVTDDLFNKNIYENIESKIETYNRKYYVSENSTPADHLVYSGFYTDDIAKLLSIDLRLRDCRSIKDVFQYYLYPNNTVKYRQKGRYKVEGVKEMIDRIWKDHNRYLFMKNFVLYYFLLQISIIYFISLMPLPLYVKIPLCLIQFFNPWVPLFIGNGTNLHGLFNSVLFSMLIATLFYVTPYFIAGGLLFTLITTLVGRKVGMTRVVLNDMKNKKNYKGFYQDYKNTFDEVVKEKNKSKIEAKSSSIY